MSIPLRARFFGQYQCHLKTTQDNLLNLIELARSSSYLHIFNLIYSISDIFDCVSPKSHFSKGDVESSSCNSFGLQVDQNAKESLIDKSITRKLSSK